jgi:hypothetical protein
MGAGQNSILVARPAAALAAPLLRFFFIERQ